MLFRSEVEQIKIQKEVEQIRIKLAMHKQRISTCKTEIERINQRKEQLHKNLEEVEGKIKDLKDALEKAPKDELEQKTKDLSDSLQKIGQYMYQKNQEEPRSPKAEAETETKAEEKKDVEEGEVVS